MCVYVFMYTTLRFEERLCQSITEKDGITMYIINIINRTKNDYILVTTADNFLNWY